MKIESIIRRRGGTVITFGKDAYHFKPEAKDGPHFADVSKEAHAERLLAIPEGFRKAQAAAKAPAPASEPAAAPPVAPPAAPAPEASASPVASGSTPVVADAVPASEAPKKRGGRRPRTEAAA
jgi:hypothetical protein